MSLSLPRLRPIADLDLGSRSGGPLLIDQITDLILQQTIEQQEQPYALPIGNVVPLASNDCVVPESAIKAQ